MITKERKEQILNECFNDGLGYIITVTGEEFSWICSDEFKALRNKMTYKLTTIEDLELVLSDPFQLMLVAKRLLIERQAYRLAALNFKHKAEQYEYPQVERLGFIQEVDAEAARILEETK